MQGVRNVLAHERLFLPTVDTTIDFLRIAHGRIMPYLLAALAVMPRMVRHCFGSGFWRQAVHRSDQCLYSRVIGNLKIDMSGFRRLPGAETKCADKIRGCFCSLGGHSFLSRSGVSQCTMREGVHSRCA
jgi:hypothetical protein